MHMSAIRRASSTPVLPHVRKISLPPPNVAVPSPSTGTFRPESPSRRYSIAAGQAPKGGLPDPPQRWLVKRNAGRLEHECHPSHPGRREREREHAAAWERE